MLSTTQNSSLPGSWLVDTEAHLASCLITKNFTDTFTTLNCWLAYPIIWQQGHSGDSVAILTFPVTDIFPEGNIKWHEGGHLRAWRGLWFPSSTDGPGTQHTFSSLGTVMYRNKLKPPKWEQTEVIYYSAHYSKSQPPSHASDTNSKMGRGVETLYSEKKEGLRYVLMRGCWHGQAREEFTRNRAS